MDKTFALAIVIVFALILFSLIYIKGEGFSNRMNSYISRTFNINPNRKIITNKMAPIAAHNRNIFGVNKRVIPLETPSQRSGSGSVFVPYVDLDGQIPDK